MNNGSKMISSCARDWGYRKAGSRGRQPEIRRLLTRAKGRSEQAATGLKQVSSLHAITPLGTQQCNRSGLSRVDTAGPNLEDIGYGQCRR